MSKGFYPKLAWSAIRKNYRLYIPYILACTGMVMMMYILCSLTCNETVSSMRGGYSLVSMLELGKIVIALFALIFLFYTNAFILKRRTRELGLYNILGMDKGNLCRLVAAENAIIALISLVSGIALGIVFSKLAELCLINLLKEEISLAFYVPIQAILTTAMVFAVIFALLFINSFIIVRKSRPLELLKNASVGEKPPKANWLLAVLGVLLLGGAYVMAVSIKSPLSAITLFFLAVIMVIIATNLLFISGSVTLCRLLQSRKSFYYKAKNFVSVSSMAYRVKRNGAGLAAVCILSTMVLVTLSSTCCLFLGAEDSLEMRYPREVSVQITMESLDELSDDNVMFAHDAVLKSLNEASVAEENWLEYRAASISGVLTGGKLAYDPDAAAAYNDMVATDNAVMCKIVSADEFNSSAGTAFAPADDEVYIIAYRTTYDHDTFQIGDGKEYIAHDATGQTTSEILCDSAALMMPTLTVVVNDFFDFAEQLENMLGNENMVFLNYDWYCGYDIEGNDRDMIFRAEDALSNQMFKICTENKTFNCACYYLDTIEDNRADFYGTYGGLFFVGIVLSIVFLCGAVLIIYYKQISEGYEDQSRFEIMKKVGMTGKDIRQSIRSQMLVVFFSPLLLAGLHLAFAFPLIWKILVLFNMANIELLIFVTVCAYILFGVFYFVVYMKTSDSYYKIVNGLRSVD